MQVNGAPSDRFGPAAREAARASRQRVKEEKERAGPLGIFVVRGDSPRCFVWELRRFGGVTLERSADTFPTSEAAHEAGALARGAGSLGLQQDLTT